ncbi:tRNA (adenosine(37)-N6)-threonylcarbamoyltransferase complex ATPase subunit type 1 TsaE [Candidatus Kaiserbacteria bacterium RIFOXYB1_FULL_46_14]|uniref:tRNA threonylcarbamoyladenosine biosynthesis protein TsaE n=1 Tax=Candidatus Kaiserbacteria bacterium RIFOXYB1_FULL_46_14 TaxID=1798531 RepID=A0A1F6FIA0_9BACT|nr:MAG: tRNA (adenosine(37)-N6)-threonylcarbamoyltransferase complex ATPase subunit type 1 TsaE [Candidatus Kaiserbacteria bacterium RIFOXYB1_FULL_46_14]
MKDRQWDITDLSDLEQAAKEILQGLAVAPRPAPPAAMVLALHGDLGAGKTTFVQILAKHLGVSESVTSPTFVIMKKYQTTDKQFSTLVHIDAYRLESADELTVLGFAEELSRGDTIICIEWAERVADLLPPSTQNLQFAIDSDNHRSLTLE